MSVVVLAEKPSVARDIAAVLGANERRGGWLEGNGYQVTWAVGHLVGLAQPHQIDERWAAWRPELLPMLPKHFPLVPRDSGADQLKVVRRLFQARGVKEIVCATDAGREGELIFRWIYDIVECTRPVRRLWISSLTQDAIREGFRNLKPSAQYDALAAAARARAIVDWLTGMNFSRAYSLASGDSLNVGRVKTPTLAMVVARELAVTHFVPEPYREVQATFVTEVGEFKATYVRGDFDKKGKPIMNAKLPATAGEPPDPLVAAELILARARAGAAVLKQVDEEKIAVRPPLLYDLTELQRDGNRLLGWTAAQVLEVAQDLYEKHKLLSYPRTDSRHLSQTVAETLGAIVSAVRGRYEQWLVAETGVAPLSRRFVDDSKVSDHHAIIPTGSPATHLAPESDAAKLYDLVCRRFLCAWQPDGIDATTKVDVAVSTAGMEDRYQASGKAILRSGWRALDFASSKRAEKEPALPAGLRRGMAATVRDPRIASKETRPPEFFTDATLLSAMESAGASLEGELSAAMRDRGLGTPATRATTIEELVAKEYMRRQDKQLRATELGVSLVRRVHKHVASPAMTGDLEAKLRRIERGQGDPAQLLEEVSKFVQETTKEALANGVAPRKPRPTERSHGRQPAKGQRRPRAALKTQAAKSSVQ
jgi:DNA topoisomerase-3